MEEFAKYFYSFDVTRDLIVNNEDEEEIDFETLDRKFKWEWWKWG